MFKSFYVFLILFLSTTVFASDHVDHQLTYTIADRQLNIDKESQELVKKQFSDLKSAKKQQLQLLNEKGVTKSTLKHAQLDFIAAQAAVEGANIALTDAKEAVEDTDTSIRGLEKDLQSLILLTKGNQEKEDNIISVEANLEFLKRLHQLQTQRIITLNDIKLVTEQRLNLENNWQQRLQTLYATQQQTRQRNHLTETLSHLQQQQQDWLIKLSNLTQELQVFTHQTNVSDASFKKLHLQILEAEENVALIRLKSYLVHMQTRVQNLQQINKKTSTALNDTVEQASNLLDQLNSTKEFVKAKMRFITMKKNELATDLQKQILSVQDAYDYSEMLTNLIHNYDKEINNISALEDKTSHYQHEFKLQLQHHLSERQTFPSDLNGWIALGQHVSQIPYLMINAFQNFIKQMVFEYKSLNNWVLNFIIALVPVLLGCWFFFRRFLLTVEINIKENKQRFSTNIIFMMIELVRRNLGSMLIFGIFLALTLCVNVSSPFFIYLLSIYLCFKLFLSMAKLALLENTNDISGADVKLYYRIRWSLMLGFFLSTLTLIAHHLPVAYEAKGFVNRLFMVFILIIALQLFKARTVIPKILESIIHIPKRYFYRAIQIINVLIPVALVFNAVIGLLGYVELAWAVAKYQVIFLVVLMGYLIVRGLIIDTMEFISELFIRYVKQGWLWTEAFLKPLDRIVRVIFFLLSALFLMHLYKLDNNEFFLNFVNQLLHRKLFTFGGNAIDALILCELLVIISLIKWLAHWSREFSYRWIYVKAKDVGVRNSLSIFTQYASVIISVLIGLKFLGIDLRGFTVVAAAFAAGIGFGMRDLIVNFFSGILLLIERPFRNGDIITLGNYEGEVIVTGMRSMTIRTWDHMEVIVPNADMFTKAFVNWTHHDNIVRTVITLKIHREDDPYKVQKLILDLLQTLPSVAKEPIAEVIMHELSDSLIEMQVRYFVLLTPTRTRTGVRSEVLFAIWDCFKANNIRAPHPQYDLIVKNNRNEIFNASEFEFNS